MDIGRLGGKALDFIKKYRYPILVLVIGIVLMTLPTAKQEETSVQKQVAAAEPAQDMAKELEAILAQIRGVGKVSVLLTQAAGESYIYQFDEDISASDSGSSAGKDTVIITDSDRNQQALISQVLPPTYQGAIIVCQGADSSAIRLAVVEAVSKATGLSTDKISVLKMK